MWAPNRVRTLFTPVELPVEVNPKIEFVINLQTAKALGLTIAPEVLYQANRLLR
ncbi:MAG: hypothetical protein ACRERE_27785 [Candidatus Entotheonellia bacterium]